MAKKLFTILLIFSFFIGFSQNFKDDNRIYVLDLTGSMWGAGAGTDIFNEVRESLVKTINSLDNPTTDISIITFGKEVIDIWNAQATEDGKKELIKKLKDIKEYNNQAIRMATNICVALETAYKELDSNKFNYLFLYTDGGHNYYKGNKNNSLQCVKDIVAKICAKNNRTDDVYPFYIMLTKKASSQELKNALKCFTVYDNNCPNPEIVIVRPAKKRYSIDLLQNKLSTNIAFISNKSSSLIGEVNLKIELNNNQNFELKQSSFNLSPDLGEISIDFIPKRSFENIKSELPINSKLELQFEIEYADKVENCKTIEIRPSKSIIDVINVKEKTVNISIINNE